MQSGIAKSVGAASDGVMTSMPEMCSESVSTYYNPVPGMSTILSCVEKKVPIDTGPTPTLTVNLREKMEEIRQMFYEGNSTRQHQETLDMGMSTVELKSISTRGPSVPIYIHKDAPAALSPDHLGGLWARKDEPSPLQLAQPEEPLGLQIFKDPEGLAALEAEAKRPRQPLRTITHTSAARHPLPLPTSDEENLGFVAVKQGAAARIDPAAMTVSTLTLPIVFDPPCASTSVFTGGLVPFPPASAPPNPDTMVHSKQQQQQQLQEEDDMVMEMSSPSPSPSRPDSPLADAFNLFVHSPDSSGRLRIDVTQFMNAFLIGKASKTKDSENKQPPPFQ
ncbi:unnamed protein product [Taenia asiatica]|uniref:Uncharacterized protein n=1 Tax=Taenia asiatica TaxID=60517 RepID=A0A3P6QZ05_TAEAS|nr:unnamed protein product [Taenia asiatica]